MNDWVNKVLPFYSVEITLQFTRLTQLPIFHRAQLTGFVRNLVNAENRMYAGHLLVESIEDGQTSYKPGDDYRFGVTVFTGGLDLFKILLNALESLPVSNIHVSERKYRFRRNNIRLISIRDRLDKRTPFTLRQATAYDAEIFRYEHHLWHNYIQQYPLVWHLTSPLRLSLPQKIQQQRNTKTSKDRYCSDPDDLNADYLLHRNMESIRALIEHHGFAEPEMAPDPPGISFINKKLRWVEDSYKSGQHRKYLSGLMGEIHFPPIPDINPFQSASMVLGQHLGMGEQPAFGLGRYRMETHDEKTANVIAPLVSARLSG